MYITMHLQDKPFQKIKSGQKTIEMRLFDGKRRFLTRGDTIEFIGANDERLICEVLGVHIYQTFIITFLKVSWDMLKTNKPIRKIWNYIIHLKSKNRIA